MRLKHIFTIAIAGIISLGFQSCLPDTRSELPVSEETYIFPFRSEVDALSIAYPGNVERDVYINSEECSDNLKKSILEEVPPLSNKQLLEVGKMIHEELFADQVTEHEKKSLAREIINRMKPHLVEKQYPYHLYVIEEEYFNAFTMPGGNIYITTTALDAVRNEDELAFIIGHELGHNENDHTREAGRLFKYARQLEDEYGLAGSLLGMVAILFNSTCGKADELESDLSAFYLAHKAGYDPEKALGGFDLLKQFSTPKTDDPLTQLIWIFTGSHPWSEDREAIASNYVRQSKVNTNCEEIFTDRKGTVITKTDPLTLRAYPLKYLSGFKIPRGSAIDVICDAVEQKYQKGRDWLYVKYTTADSTYYGWVDKQYVEF